MKKLLSPFAIVLLVAMTALPMVACAPKEEPPAEEPMEEAAEAMGEAAEDMGEAAEEMGEEMHEGMEEMGEAAEEMGEAMGEEPAAEPSGETPPDA